MSVSFRWAILANARRRCHSREPLARRRTASTVTTNARATGSKLTWCSAMADSGAPSNRLGMRFVISRTLFAMAVRTADSSPWTTRIRLGRREKRSDFAAGSPRAELARSCSPTGHRERVSNRAVARPGEPVSPASRPETRERCPKASVEASNPVLEGSEERIRAQPAVVEADGDVVVTAGAVVPVSVPSSEPALRLARPSAMRSARRSMTAWAISVHSAYQA